MADSCPRCGFVYNPDREDLAMQQVEVCDYCAENYRRLVAGKRLLPEPTEDFPSYGR